MIVPGSTIVFLLHDIVTLKAYNLTLGLRTTGMHALVPWVIACRPKYAFKRNHY